jgi:hypothetical protein
MGRLRIINGGRDAQPFRLTADERRAIEWEVERLIAALDADDGDADLEAEEDACGAGDDGCGAMFIHGRRVWGSDHDEPFANTPNPRWGIDQTRGPINHPLAVAGYLAQQEGR